MEGQLQQVQPQHSARVHDLGSANTDPGGQQQAFAPGQTLEQATGRSEVKQHIGDGIESDYQLESDEDPNEDAEARKARKKLRRACDYCTRKKVRCDGARPCQQCQRKEQECKFSICQRTGPRSLQQTQFMGQMACGKSHMAGPAAMAAMSAATASATAAAAASGGPGPPPSSQMRMALSGGGIASKVDVTYLNFFLKEFNAFVPLTTQDILRDALNPSPLALTEHSPDGDEEYRRQNARVAVIQGCICIGAMIKGQTQIVTYLKNVREALTACFDFVSPETMSAYMVSAYCSDLMGNAAAARNYMEFAKAVATQLPQVTVDHELVFQFYRVCSEVHNCSLSATPKLLQQAGSAAPCYQVLNVLTYAMYDLAHLATEELNGTISRDQVTAELNSLLPILMRADGMSCNNASSFGALGLFLIKGSLAYVLVRLGRSQEGLQVLEPVVDLLMTNPGLLRQVMSWHLTHCTLVIFLEHGGFHEYEKLRSVHNGLLHIEKGERHFKPWSRGRYQDCTPYPAVDQLHVHGNSFLCTNPICKAVNKDLSEDVNNVASSISVPTQGVVSGEQDGVAEPLHDHFGAAKDGENLLINMVAGGGFINFDGQGGVNVHTSSVVSASKEESPTPSLPKVDNAAAGQERESNNVEAETASGGSAIVTGAHASLATGTTKDDFHETGASSNDGDPGTHEQGRDNDARQGNGKIHQDYVGFSQNVTTKASCVPPQGHITEATSG